MLINKENQSIIIGGSANFTIRNLDDFNLENNLLTETEKNSRIAKDINDYLNRIWTNEDGYYTVDYDKYKNESFLKAVLYRFQEWSGLSTFKSFYAFPSSVTTSTSLERSIKIL